MKFVNSLCLLGAVSMSLPAAASTTALYFNGTQGSYVSGGQETLITPSSDDGWNFSVPNSADKSLINAGLDNFGTNPASGNTTWWDISFKAPEGSQIEVGSYELASRYPFQGPAQPGFDFSGDGRGSNQLTAQFDVLEAVYDANGDVESFAADFIQYGENNFDEYDWGSFRYNSAFEINETPIAFTTDTAGQQGDNPFSFFYRGTPNSYVTGGQSELIEGVPWSIFVNENFDNGISISLDGPGNWDIDLAAPGGAPLTTGFYANAERFPFQETGNPGLDFSGNGAGYNMLNGYFNILELEFGPDGLASVLAVDLLQRGENSTTEYDWASLRYNSDIALTTAPVPLPASLWILTLALASLRMIGRPTRAA